MCNRCVGYLFCQAEDGIRDLVRSRGLGDVYKRQEFYKHIVENDQEFAATEFFQKMKWLKTENEDLYLSLIHI